MDSVKLYRDNYGRIWKRVGDRVYRKDTGWGGWFGGHGLAPYELPKRDKKGRFLK